MKPIKSFATKMINDPKDPGGDKSPLHFSLLWKTEGRREVEVSLSVWAD